MFVIFSRLTIDESDNDQPVLFTQSKYFDLEDFVQDFVPKKASVKNGSTSYSMLNINARSILSKIDEILTLLHIIKVQCNFTFDLICIEESWLNENTEQLAAIPGYNLITKHKKTKQNRRWSVYLYKGIHTIYSKK